MRRPLLLASLLLALGVSAQGRLDVSIELNRATGGTLRVALCPNEASYKQELGCQLREAAATKNTTVVSFDALPPGTYAIKVFHDVNNNGELDTNFIGIPKEPYGFSNDAMGTFGPPSFLQAGFTVRAGSNVVRIRMKG